jgi:transcriptional regulator with XRE-family HTH domain
MNTFDKIREARELLGLNQTQFAEKVGVTQKDVSNLEAGNKKFIPNKYIDFLLNSHFDLNSVFDPTSDLKKMTVTKVDEPTKVYKLRTDNNVSTQLIPLYSLEATAGLVELFQHTGDSKPIDHISIPNLPKCDGAVFTVGDSMYPLLKSGDIVMYKELQDIREGIFYGEMYLISLDVDGEEYVSVKWIHKSEKGEDYIKLVSENRHHQPKDVHLDKVRAMAIVKASIRINAMR